MRSPRAIALLAVFCGLVIGPAPTASAQETAASATEDAEREAAVLARRESLEFRQRLDELRQAQQARLEAIKEIAEVQAIDAELEQLRARTREMLALRREVIERNVVRLEPFRREVEAAQEEVRSTDPVRKLLEQRREDSAVVVASAAP